MLETIDPGLGESVQLIAVDRGGGAVVRRTGGMCLGMEEDLACGGVDEPVEDRILVEILRSSIALNMGAAEICS